ncbi:hypothetical protein [Microbacter margulisiae]|uniref:Uncharacterized protein n=1 Tax=Microbacter margulisiae TaxID=1350067 RepID=A0A7W5DQV8_9PORP|nr:hypothetical protein [Microbacter margulisiae]MBB3187417.1 hypothetical protein [Microbacter margulisiae]
MAKIKNYQQFIEDVADRNFRPYVKRFQELAGLRPTGVDAKETYLIEVTFDFGNSLLEHESIKNFKKTNNRYYLHPELTNPPVKGHYHVIPSNGKQEIYAVNLDGTAHHKVNKGYQIPTKEADELRGLGVDIKDDRIIESIEFLESDQKQLLTESLKHDCISIFIEIEE